MANILLINGPNLNLLGRREPEIYGKDTLADIEARLGRRAHEAGHHLATFQSNSEGALIDRIHAAIDEGTDAIIINPGAYTHTSIALRDALAGCQIPFYEVHISNIHERETFRHHSYLSDLAREVIMGKGVEGYEIALDAAARSFTH